MIDPHTSIALRAAAATIAVDPRQSGRSRAASAFAHDRVDALRASIALGRRRQGAQRAAIAVMALAALVSATLTAPSLALPPDAAEVKPVEKHPLKTLPYTPSLDPAAMDRSADPCVDFYTYSCGGWKKNNPIPPDQPRWDVYHKLYDENQQYLWGILEEASAPDASRSPNTQKIGDYFASCMDEEAIEKVGIGATQADLDAIAALTSTSEVPALLARLHLKASGSGTVFGFGADQDPKNSEQVIAWVFAGGLGLPDRDYYFKSDKKSKETRARYLAHVQTMLELTGDSPKAAAKGAKMIMRLETSLAKATLTRVESRDPYKIYHKMTVSDFQDMTPAFNWREYLKVQGIPTLDALNVTEPAFFKEMNSRLKKVSLDDWKIYLRWHTISDRAPYLSQKFVKPDFDFYRAYLRGVKAQRPRWQRCVSWTDRDLGEALGQVFAEKTFPPDTKRRTLEMTTLIEKAMEKRINGLTWMSAATKKQALAKLASMKVKIGYPDKWRDYSALVIQRGEFLGNVTRSIEFESKRQLAKIGKPVDRTEWGMTPPTVNAYYNALMNDINFPAGVLQPPLYDPKLDDAPNYGNTGSTIGHELTHGFDDEGRKFDAKGNLNDWWTQDDTKEFEKRAACISDQYAKYVVVDDIKINSKLTLGEDVADLGGSILAWAAWKEATAGMNLQPIDGLTPDQRFFVGLAQWACENDRDENRRLNALTNEHSPNNYRINGLVANMPEFAGAFSCKPGQPLVNANVCTVW